jgi:hypothetical protein
MDENQNNPEENLPGKQQQQIPPAQPISSSTIQPQQPMEVHHHGHVHEKKKWKEYIFQFVMLFLAVFLGSFAETQREKGIEKNMEEEYMESLMKDASNDSSMSRGLASDIFTQVKGIDSLQGFLAELYTSTGLERDSLVRRCYRMTKYVQTFYPYFFNESTITQLLSSGNMRLIKKENVADVIMEYHGFIKFTEVQKQVYIDYVNSAIQSMYNLYDISYLQTFMIGDTFYNIPVDSLKVRLTLFAKSTDDLKKFNAMLENTKIVAVTYRRYLLDMKSRANVIYNFLRNTYHLKEI